MSPGSEKSERPSHLSRNVALASGVVIALLVGYLTYGALEDGSPAVITFEVVASEAEANGAVAYVPIDVRNTGGRTAADVEIETRFETGDAEPLVKRTRIDFLAGRETRRIYAAGPPGAQLEVRMLGFQDP